MRSAFVFFLALLAVGCAGSLHALTVVSPDPTFVVDLPRGWEEDELSLFVSDPSQGIFTSSALSAEADILVGMTKEDSLALMRLRVIELEAEGWLFLSTDDPSLAIATNEDRRNVLRVAKASTCTLRQQTDCYVMVAIESHKSAISQVLAIADTIGQRVAVK